MGKRNKPSESKIQNSKPTQKQFKKLFIFILLTVSLLVLLALFLFQNRTQVVYADIRKLESGILLSEINDRAMLDDSLNPISSYIASGKGNVALELSSFSPNTRFPIQAEAITRIIIFPYSYSITQPQGNISTSQVPNADVRSIVDYNFPSKCPPVVLQDSPILDTATDNDEFIIQFAEKGLITITNLDNPEYYFNTKNNKTIGFHYGLNIADTETLNHAPIYATLLKVPPDTKISLTSPFPFFKSNDCNPKGNEYINVVGFQAQEQKGEKLPYSQLMVYSYPKDSGIEFVVAGGKSIEIGNENFSIPDYVKIVLFFENNKRQGLWLEGNYGGFDSIILGTAQHDIVASSITLTNPEGNLFLGNEKMVLNEIGDLEINAINNHPSSIHIDDNAQDNGSFSISLNANTQNITLRDVQLIQNQFNIFSTELKTAIFTLLVAIITALFVKFWTPLQKWLSS